jgi:uncharacterized OB-fold protein
MRPIAEGLFTDETPPRLIGGKERASGRIVFPCPTGVRFAPYPLGRTGTVWAYTIQRFRPKSPPYQGPEAFAPFPIAYVELPGEVIVEARLARVAIEDVKVGMAVEFAPIPLDPDATDSVLIPAFQPRGTQV